MQRSKFKESFQKLMKMTFYFINCYCYVAESRFLEDGKRHVKYGKKTLSSSFLSRARPKAIATIGSTLPAFNIQDKWTTLTILMLMTVHNDSMTLTLLTILGWVIMVFRSQTLISILTILWVIVSIIIHFVRSNYRSKQKEIELNKDTGPQVNILPKTFTVI